MKIKSIAHKILALGGFHAYLFTAGTGPLLIITLIMMTTVLIAKVVYKKSYMHLLFPLASGLLFLPMKLFYWDKTDYVNRINNLLLISLLLISYMAVKEFKLLPRFTRTFTRLSLRKQCVYIFIFVEILFILSSFFSNYKGGENEEDFHEDKNINTLLFQIQTGKCAGESRKEFKFFHSHIADKEQ